MRVLRLFFFLWGISIAQTTFAQETKAFVVIDSIKLEGNKNTRHFVIIRELDIKLGDTIPLSCRDSLFISNRNRILNTQLFHTAELCLQYKDSLRANLLVKVRERWYIFPNIIFELADRNFNEWWYNRNHDLRRTNYGLRFTHKNMWGRAELLRLTVQSGFTRRYDFSYDIPYIDRTLKNGLSFSAAYSENKQAAFRSGTIEPVGETRNNVLEFYPKTLDEAQQIQRTRFESGITYTRRSKFYLSHNLEFGYRYNTISNELALRNPDYFLNGRTIQQYFYLAFNVTFDKRDIQAYPLNGDIFSFNASRLGLRKSDDIDIFSVSANYAMYRPLGKKYYWSAGLQARYSTPGLQPYANFRAMGFGLTYVRGYDLYVIDGNHFGLAKFTLKREIIKFEKSFPKLIPIPEFQTIPFNIYLKTYFDTGYVVDQTNNVYNSRLANRWIYGGGGGIDIVTFYNLVIGLDYTVNRENERRFFFRLTRDI
ncbi:MAG: BamA/TamA family outer membrane protein [Verrucomicrobia bacterium]|nr:BamA/TamA family outer membrane protein [Cytophagales bacterium]